MCIFYYFFKVNVLKCRSNTLYCQPLLTNVQIIDKCKSSQPRIHATTLDVTKRIMVDEIIQS